MSIYLNGQFVDEKQATVSVFDRGFLFGDGVYEIIPVYGPHLFAAEAHLQRLQVSLKAIQLDSPLSNAQWLAIIEQLMHLNPATDVEQDRGIYLQVTRGVAPRDHLFPEATQPTVLAMLNTVEVWRYEQRLQGAKAVLVDDIRWRRCDIKSISLLGNVLLRQQAKQMGAAEALLVQDGYIFEGAASNVFAVINGEILTPPLSDHLLSGVTRRLILDILRKQQIPHREALLSVKDLQLAEEIWITSSTKEILPITQLDEHQVGDGCAGVHWERINSAYQSCKQALRQGLQTC